jgi:hypothetical protein
MIEPSKTTVRELTCEEYLEFMFLKWYYGHIQAYINNIPFEHEDYNTFQEWIVDYYEHPEWGSNFRLKAPESYKKDAKNYASYGYEKPEKHKITEGDK